MVTHSGGEVHTTFSKAVSCPIIQSPYPLCALHAQLPVVHLCKRYGHCAATATEFCLRDKYSHKETSMSQQTLREVRDSLLQMNTIQHEREFCERWLCKSECYLRTLKVNHIDASADALATLASKLGHYADELERSDQRHHRHHAREFKRLAQLCEQSLFVQAERKWRSRAV